MLIRKFFISLFITLLSAEIIFCQVIDHKPSDFRGDVNYRKNSNVDGNNLRVTIFNSGYSGNPGNRADYVNYEYPKNTNRIYISVVNILLGGEVKSTNGQTIHLV